MGLRGPAQPLELLGNLLGLEVPGEHAYRCVTCVQLAADPGGILVGHPQALMEELADGGAAAGASEYPSDQGEAACGDRRDHAEGDADAHPSLAGALAELVLLDLAVVVLDEHADGVDLHVLGGLLPV